MLREIYLPYFKDKKVTVLGLGLLGRGVGDTKFLVENGADVICTDTRSEEKLKESIGKVTEGAPANLKLVIGENRYEDFENRDFILTCPGMPIGYAYLEHAKKHGIPVHMSASLVSEIVMEHLDGVTIIGITGTRGKSTVTQLIAHILESAHSRVRVGGNIRNGANLPLLDTIEDGDYLILELDSWQLQGFGDAHISPHIAVFTSFLDDHMNYYKDDKEVYFKDKANIYRNQKEGDVLIASAQASGEILMREKRQAIVIPEKRHFEMNLIGDHNQIAAGLAYEVALQCGLDEETILEAIKTFKAVPGRLEDMGVHKGVRIFNDNNGTTPDAVVAGIKAIIDTYGQKPILIMGGAEKGLPLARLEEVVQQDTKACVLLAGTGTEKLSLSKDHMFDTLEACIECAFSLADEGDILLFSPGFASFGKQFNNEYERNDVFVQEIAKYA